jgi:hypothetical protein
MHRAEGGGGGGGGGGHSCVAADPGSCGTRERNAFMRRIWRKENPKILTDAGTNKWLGGGGGEAVARRSCCKARKRKILILKSCALRECQNLNGHSITGTAVVVARAAATRMNPNTSEREREQQRGSRGAAALSLILRWRRGGGGGREWRFFVITAGTTPASLLTNHLTNLNH